MGARVYPEIRKQRMSALNRVVSQSAIGRAMEGMMKHRHGLTDEQFAKLLSVIARKSGRGRPAKDHRLVIDGMLWILSTGAPWRDLPSRFGPWKTVCERFRLWTASGLWVRIIEELGKGVPEVDRSEAVMFCVDGTSMRAHRSAAGAHEKLGSANLTTTP